VRKFGYEILEGLSYLHANGTVFADLKPQNILLNEYCNLKLCDFGLAKKINEIKNADGENASQLKAGTPFYMAPELFSDTGVHSFYSDFWSLGCILYELATGKPPFCSSSFKDLVKMIVDSDFPRIEAGSGELNDLIQKLLEKDPIKRINWDELKAH